MRQLLFLRDSRKWAIRKRDSRKRAALPGRPLRSGIFDVAAACGLRPAACDLRPATCGLRPAACDLRPATCGLRPAACGLRPAACG